MELSSLRWTRAIVALAACFVALGVVAGGDDEEQRLGGGIVRAGPGEHRQPRGRRQGAW